MKILEIIKNWYLRTFKADDVNIVSTEKVYEEDRATDYYVGASPLQKRVVLPGGHWKEIFTPEAEIQKGLFESFNCVLFSLLNEFEFLAFYKWGEVWNKSDRFSGAVCKTTDRGNYPQRSLDLTRNVYGVVDEKDWPVDWNKMSKSEYRKWPTQEVINKGKDWLKFYEVGYERVNQTPQEMITALGYSPLWVNGCAWIISGGLYRSWGAINHQFLVIDYDYGKCWYVFDSYAPYIKKLAWDYKFGTMRIILLNKANLGPNQPEINKLLDKGIEYILLVEPYENFDAGAYQLTREGIVKAPLKILLDNGIIKLAEAKKLQGRKPSDFVKLLK